MPDLAPLTFMHRSDPSDHLASRDVVEIPLLLPSNQAAALLELSRLRHQSVGQILREIITREIRGTADSISFPTLHQLHSPCRGSSAL